MMSYNVVLGLLCSVLLETHAIQRMTKMKTESIEQQKQPNILYILLDDWGWGDARWHRTEDNVDSAPKTVHMDELRQQGVEIDRHYVFRVCSPTRSAIQSGRNPLQVNVQNFQPFVTWDTGNNVSGYAGIPLPMTTIAEHLSRAGYDTHLYGKWDAGMATYGHTPQGRGYKYSIAYWGHGNDYWDYTNPMDCRDETGETKFMRLKELWAGDRPATDIGKGAEGCSQDQQEGCTFEEQLFKTRVMNAIRFRNKDKPFFIFWAPHLVHVPMEIPQHYEDRWASIKDTDRRIMNAMIEYADDEIKEVVGALHEQDIWDDTLIVVHSDNGGYVEGASSNYPLKGGKNTNWEGGIRATAFVSGGFLPSSVRGTKMNGLMAAWDWYATFAALAGVDPTDHRADAAGLPPIDSFNMWPMLSGQVQESPRKYLIIGDTNDVGSPLNGSSIVAMVGGIIMGEYKLLVGEFDQASWTPPNGANETERESHYYKRVWETCKTTPRTGCLYNIYKDPEERHNLAVDNRRLFHNMLRIMNRESKKIYNPYRGEAHPDACRVAVDQYGGFLGPFAFNVGV